MAKMPGMTFGEKKAGSLGQVCIKLDENLQPHRSALALELAFLILQAIGVCKTV